MTNFVPASIEEAQTWLRQRLEQPKPFQIRGNQTHFQAKAIPSSAESEDVLSLSKLTATNFFDPDDMVVGVEAGMSISKLQEILAEEDGPASESLVRQLHAWWLAGLQRYRAKPADDGRPA